MYSIVIDHPILFRGDGITKPSKHLRNKTIDTPYTSVRATMNGWDIHQEFKPKSADDKKRVEFKKCNNKFKILNEMRE